MPNCRWAGTGTNVTGGRAKEAYITISSTELISFKGASSIKIFPRKVLGIFWSPVIRSVGDANLGNLFVVSVSSEDDDERMMWRLLSIVGERDNVLCAFNFR